MRMIPYHLTVLLSTSDDPGGTARTFATFYADSDVISADNCFRVEIGRIPHRCFFWIAALPTLFL